jgi:hypothetical protein
MARAEEKARRMELRRATGNRKVKAPPAKGSPSAPYRIVHACFTCRRSFKLQPQGERGTGVCPGCGGSLYQMGRSFKPPPTRDRKQWAKVQALYAYGFRFFSYRSFMCASLPSHWWQVEEFVRDNPEHPFRVAQPNLSLLPPAPPPAP